MIDKGRDQILIGEQKREGKELTMWAISCSYRRRTEGGGLAEGATSRTTRAGGGATGAGGGGVGARGGVRMEVERICCCFNIIFDAIVR